MVRKEGAKIQNLPSLKAAFLWGDDPFRYGPPASADEKLHRSHSNSASQNEQDLSGSGGVVFEGEFKEVDSEAWAEGPVTQKWAALKRSGALYRGRRFGGRI